MRGLLRVSLSALWPWLKDTEQIAVPNMAMAGIPRPLILPFLAAVSALASACEELACPWALRAEVAYSLDGSTAPVRIVNCD